MINGLDACTPTEPAATISGSAATPYTRSILSEMGQLVHEAGAQFGVVKEDHQYYSYEAMTHVQHPHDDGVWLGNLATLQKEDHQYYSYEAMTHVQHPHDDGVWLGNLATLQALPQGVDAVVSLCRVNDNELPVGVEQIDVRLIDDVGPDTNPTEQ